MHPSELKKRVDKILEVAHDDERAHGEEDQLHLDVIHEFCPDWVQAEIDRLSEGGFSRWCA